MNKVHRTLWNNALNAWVAVAENTKSSGKTKASKTLLATPLLAALTATGALAAPPNPPATNALPTGGVVSAGTASLSQAGTTAAPVLNINQSTPRAAINWNTFNVGQAATVNFNQPNAQSVTLNRVADSNPSQIFGKINAIGQVYLVNPSGVYFGRTASVDVRGLVATTHNMSDAAFMAGGNTFLRNGATGRVENEGELKARLDGYIALLAPEVVNSGVIVAERGTAVLANGESITLDFNADHKLSGIVVTASDIASLIENKQAIETPDGQIIMSAQSVSALRGSLIKNSGSLIANTGANSIARKGGRILLEGDDITLSGTSKIEAKGEQGGGTVLVGGDWQGSNGVYQATKTTMEAGATIDASATQNGDGGKVVLWSDIHNAASVTTVAGSIKAEGGLSGGNGGQIETSGAALDVSGVAVSARSYTGGRNGLWLLDPTYASFNASTINTALNGGNDVTVLSSAAISMDGAISVTTAPSTVTLTLDNTAGSMQAITLGQTITQSGSGGLNLLAKSAGGSIGVSSAVNIANGNVTLDNTYGCVGVSCTVQSGFITSANASTLAAASANGGVYINAAITASAGNITLSGANSSGPGVYLINALTANPTLASQSGLGVISISGATASGVGVRFITQGGSTTTTTGGTYWDRINTWTPTASRSVKANKIVIFGDSLNSTAVELGTYYYQVQSAASTDAAYLYGGTGFSVTGKVANTSTAGIVGRTGTTNYLYSYISYEANGGDLRFSSNGRIFWDGTGASSYYAENYSPMLYLAANNSSAVQNLIYDSTAGDKSSVVASIPYLQIASTSSSKTNISIYTNGADIAYSQYTGTVPRKTDSTNFINGSFTADNICSICAPQNRLTYLSDATKVTSNIAFTRSLPNTSALFRFTDQFSVNVLSSSLSNDAIYFAHGMTVGNILLKSAIMQSVLDAANGVSTTTTTTGAPGLGGGNINLWYSPITTTGSSDSEISAGYNMPAGSIYGGAVVVAPNNNYVRAGTGRLKVFTGSLTLTPTTDYTSAMWINKWSGSGTTFSANLAQNFVYAANYSTLGSIVLTPTTNPNNAVVYNRFAPTVNMTVNADVTNDSVYGTATDADLIGNARAILKPATTIAVSGSWYGSPTTNQSYYLNSLYDNLRLENPVALSGAGLRPVGVYHYRLSTVPIAGVTLNVGTGGDTNFPNSYLTVTPANLTVSGLAVSDKPYDGTVSATVTGAPVYNGMLAGDAVSFTYSGGNYDLKDVGIRSVVLTGAVSGADASNYSIVTPASLQGTIMAKALTISGQTATNKTYDGTNAVTLSSGSLVGVVAGEDVDFTQSGTFSQVNAGTGIAVNVANALTGTAIGNYTLTQPTGLTADITPKTVTLSATKVYDGTTGLTGYVTLGGFVGSETLTYTGATASSSQVAAAGKYISAITLADGALGGLASNYQLPTLDATNAAVSITPALLGITAAATYNGSTTVSPSSQTLTGLVSADSAVTLSTMVLNSKDVASASHLTAFTLSNGGESNYALNAGANATAGQSTTNTVTLSAKTLSVSGLTVSNKEYDGTHAATVSSWGAVTTGVGSETLTLNSGTATFASASAGTGKTVTAAGYSLADGSNGGLASNYALSSTSSTTTADITPKVLTVSGLMASNKSYDGTTAATVSGAMVTTGISGESLTLNGGAATFADANAGVDKTVTATGYSLADGTGGLASNYTLSSTNSTATATIDRKTLTVSGLAVSDKTYDGTNAITVSNWGSVTTGISGEALTLNSGTTGLSDFNAGTGKTVTASGYSLADGTGGLASNYVLSSTSSTATMDIAQKQVTVSGLTMNNRTYDRTTDVTASVSSWGTVATGIAGETLNLTPGTANLADANAGTGKTVTASGYSLANGTGGLASNYVLTSTSSTATMDIARKTVSVTGQTVSTKTYDGTTAAPVSGGALDGVISGDSVLLNQSATFASANVGAGIAVTATNTLGGTSVGNYVITTQPILPNTDIMAAPLTLTASHASKVYGSVQTFAGTEFTSSGLQNGETIGAVSLSSAGAASTVGVGSYPIVVSAASGGSFTPSNYVISYINGALSVTPKALTVNGLTVSGKTYDGTTTAAINTSGVSLSGLVGSDDVTVTVTGANFVSANAGTHMVSLTSTNGGADVGNYTITAPGSLTGTISPAPLTVTADAKSMTYGASVMPGLTYVPTGLVNGETTAVFSGALSTTATAYNGTAGSGSNAGTYPIAQGSLSAGGNYTISFTGASLTVNKAQLTVTGNSPSMTYGASSLPLLGATYAGYANGDSAPAGLVGAPTLSTTAAAYNGTAGSASSVGTYAVTTSVAGMSSTNYTFAPVHGALTVNRAPISVSGLAVANKTYDSTTTATVDVSGVAYTGVLNGDVVNIAVTDAHFASANAGTHAVSLVSGLTGAQAGNYAVTTPGSLTGTITPAALSVQANDQVKNYDGLGHTAGVTYTGWVGGQNASVLAGTLDYTGVSNYDGVTVYNGEVRPGSYEVTPAGLSSGNYSISYVTGLLAIDPAPLTVTAKGFIKVLDNVPYAGGNGVDFIGFVNGESLSALTGSLTYSGTSQNANRVGIYNIAPGGLTSTDYAITFVNGRLQIKPKPVTTNLAATATVSAIQTQQAVAGSSVASAVNSTVTTAPTTSTIATTVASDTPTVTAPPVSVPVTLSNTKSALELGAFKVVGAVAPGVLDVVFVPNPSSPQTVIQVLQLPLATGQGPVPEKIMNDLYLSGGVVTASAPTATLGASGAGTTGASGAADTSGTTATAGNGTATTATSTSTSSSSAVAAGAATDTASASSTDDEKKNNVRVEQSQITTVLANDAPLPTQLTFNPEDKSFTLAKGADVKLPLQVKIQLRQGGSVVSEKLVMLTNEF